MNLLIGELFLGISSVGVLCLLGGLGVKSLKVNSLINRIIIALILIFFYMGLDCFYVDLSLYNSTITIGSVAIFLKSFLLVLVICILCLGHEYFYYKKVLVNETGVLFLLASLGAVLILYSNDFF